MLRRLLAAALAPPPDTTDAELPRDRRRDPFLTLETHHRAVAADIALLRSDVIRMAEEIRALKADIGRMEGRGEQVFSWLARLREDLAKALRDEVREELGRRDGARVMMGTIPPGEARVLGGGVGGGE